MKRKRNLIAMAGIALAFSIGFTGCGKDGGADDNSIPELEFVPIETGTEASKEESSGTVEDSSLTASENSRSEEGVSDATTSAPAISYEILRDTRTDDGGAEIAFSEYPMFTVTGTGYDQLETALASINGEYKSQNAALLDEMQENVKDYRESVDPVGVFGQGTTVSVTRCDSEVISIMVMRTVTMGGPHPNNYWDYYNLNAKTGENLVLSDFMTMDDAMTETVIQRLYENYPEVEFDDVVLRLEIPEAFAENNIGWYFYEGQINLSFPEGSFGFGHAVGSLEVTISLD